MVVDDGGHVRRQRIVAEVVARQQLGHGSRGLVQHCEEEVFGAEMLVVELSALDLGHCHYSTLALRERARDLAGVYRITHSYALAITQIYAPDLARCGA